MKSLVRSGAYAGLILVLLMFVVPRAQAQPVVHGIVNAASGDLTSIARGSFMTIYGENLGTQAGPPSSLPLPTTLGGAQVTITPSGSSKAYQAYLHFVSPGQINAVMPSAVPAGSAFLTVTVNNQTSFKAPVQISESSFGIFTIGSQPVGLAIAQNYESPTSLPLNLYTNPARQGQTLILWGTGLGAYTAGPDNQAPQAGNIVNNAKVLVDNIAITPFYAGRAPGIPGVDQINFTLPADSSIPDGCSLLIQVQVGDVVQNSAATIAKSSNAPVCQHAYGLSTDLLTKLQGGGTVSAAVALVERSYGILGVSNGAIFGSIQEEILTQFRKFAANGSPLTNQGFQYAMSQAAGTCTVIPAPNDSLDFVDYLDININSSPLDAGTNLTLSGPGTSLQFNSESTLTTIFQGTTLPGVGSGGPQSALVDGDWTITGTGGGDVKAFTAKFTLKDQFALTNIPATITRGQPFTLKWTGGGTGASDVVRITAWSATLGSTTPVAVCTVASKAGTFTVPADVTNQLAAGLGTGVLSVYNQTTPAHFTAPLVKGGNLDSAVINLGILDSFVGVTIQ